jgi:hypothetical protein
VLSFDEYLYDLSAFLQSREELRYKISDRYLHELLFPDLRHEWERSNRDRMLAEAHSRLASPLYVVTFVLMGAGRGDRGRVQPGRLYAPDRWLGRRGRGGAGGAGGAYGGGGGDFFWAAVPGQLPPAPRNKRRVPAGLCSSPI